MVRSARAQLRAASDDVTSQIQISGATARKQRLLAALELAVKVQEARDLPALVK